MRWQASWCWNSAIIISLTASGTFTAHRRNMAAGGDSERRGGGSKKKGEKREDTRKRKVKRVEAERKDVKKKRWKRGILSLRACHNLKSWMFINSEGHNNLQRRPTDAQPDGPLTSSSCHMFIHTEQEFPGCGLDVSVHVVCQDGSCFDEQWKRSWSQAHHLRDKQRLTTVWEYLFWIWIIHSCYLVADVFEHAGVLLPFCVGVGGSSLHGRRPQARLVRTLQAQRHFIHKPPQNTA